MDKILSLTKKEQESIYIETTSRSKLIKSPNIMEKDYWVCWTLKQIFNTPEISPHITFKGGTSLSKCYNLISRFSEDCDLTINKEFLGITEDAKAISNKSRNQKDKSLNALADSAVDKVNNHIKPVLINRFNEELASYFNSNEWQVESDPNDGDNQTLLFYYPSSLETGTNEYVKPFVKLEFGARGDINPSETKEISPYLYDEAPEAFNSKPLIQVPTLTATRTFWEKATLLHAEHHRDLTRPPKPRMFRHYYDIAMLDSHGITKQAKECSELLNTVLLNKKTYFSSPAAKYETANIGTLRLMPNEIFIETLRQDCERMAEMFFGEVPDFDDVMGKVEDIEKAINA